jgi:chromosome segregation ATPase
MTVIKDAIDHLTAAEELLDKLGPLEDAHDKAADELAQVEQSLAETKKELTDAKAGLSLAQVKILRDYEETVFDRSQQIKDLDSKIAEQQTKLQTLLVEVSSANARHQQIEDSINSLRQRIG